MQVPVRSPEALLVAVNVAAACLLAVIVMTRPDGAAATSAQPPSSSLEPLPVLVVVGSAGTTDELVGRAVAARWAGTVAVLQGGGLPGDVRASVDARRPRRIVVVGGPGAVTEATVRALETLTPGEVVRRAGADRYATAAEVATTEFPRPVSRVRVVTGAVAGPVLRKGVPADDGAPVLLAEPGRLPPVSAAALRELQPGRVDVAADRTAVSDDVLERLRGLTDGPVARLAAP